VNKINSDDPGPIDFVPNIAFLGMIPYIIVIGRGTGTL
jgi:hypothetical protein